MRTNFVSSVLGKKYSFFRFLRYFNPYYYGSKNKTRGETIRETLESLGPIYVKFGQMLSTRGDLVPDDIMLELVKLQDKVPPFDGHIAKGIIEAELEQSTDTLFSSFDETPLASASVAQVHAATLKSGEAVVVKVIRPNIKKIIKKDIAILYLVAKLTESLWRQGKRLHPVAVVAEFEQTLYGELDMQQEAANASLLRRNFQDSATMYVPKVYWSFVSQDVMVMERIYGIPLGNLQAIRDSGADLKKLSENGVEIFFTQVFRDSFFHADMHPGNMFIDASNPKNPRYLGVDFGIMGTLNEEDQHYLAMNLLAFFNRDYRRVAQLHVESGWVAADTRVDQFETAIRTVCEPIFEKPLAEISFGKLLLRLFQTAERFHMEVQPQLVLLQKTLFNIESLGRELYPNLDLWETAKPFMVRWLKEQKGIRHLLKFGVENFHETAEQFLKMPRLAYELLEHSHLKSLVERQVGYELEEPKKHLLLTGAIGASLLIVSITNLILLPQTHALTWTEFGIGCALGLAAIIF
jgi:ubiquinone biosynthesis protein